MRKVILVEDNLDLVDNMRDLFEFEYPETTLEVFSGVHGMEDAGLGDFVNDIRAKISSDPESEYIVVLDDKLGLENVNGAVVINALVAIPEIAERIKLVVGNSGDTGAQDGYLRQIKENKGIDFEIAKKEPQKLKYLLDKNLVPAESQEAKAR